MIRTVEVKTASAAYEVLIGHGLLAEAAVRLGPLLAGRRLALVTDDVVEPLYGAKVCSALGIKPEDRVVVPHGEGAKSFRGLETVLYSLLERRLDRGDLLIALGGGVVGDLAGFAAAIYKRGVDFVQIPTTLLAQVDSSVGGKTAIDTPHGKNLIGAFHQPRAVIADLDVLQSLPPREIRCGYAEILKAALIEGGGFFSRLNAIGPDVVALKSEALAWAVGEAVAMKARIVGEDERETGRRALLNLGHTFGHALEAETGFGGALLHGEAVALGCCLAFRFAEALGLCRAGLSSRVTEAVTAVGLPSTLRDVWPDGAPPAERLVAHMAHDKKVKGGALSFILPADIGNCALTPNVEAAKVRRFLQTEGAP